MFFFLFLTFLSGWRTRIYGDRYRNPISAVGTQQIPGLPRAVAVPLETGSTSRVGRKGWHVGQIYQFSLHIANAMSAQCQQTLKFLESGRSPRNHRRYNAQKNHPLKGFNLAFYLSRNMRRVSTRRVRQLEPLKDTVLPLFQNLERVTPLRLDFVLNLSGFTRRCGPLEPLKGSVLPLWKTRERNAPLRIGAWRFSGAETSRLSTWRFRQLEPLKFVAFVFIVSDKFEFRVSLGRLGVGKVRRRERRSGLRNSLTNGRRVREGTRRAGARNTATDSAKFRLGKIFEEIFDDIDYNTPPSGLAESITDFTADKFGNRSNED